MRKSTQHLMIYRVSILAIVLFAAFCFNGSAQAQKKIIHAGHLIDGIADQSQTQMSIIIEDGRITSIDKGFTQARAGDTVIDLSQQYVMPGLMDMHVHLSGQTKKGGYIDRFRLYPTDQALISTQYLKTTLMAGFTTVRDVGSGGGVSIALRNAVRRGDIVGPRMFVAGKSLAVMGGHGDATNGFREDILGIPDADDGVVSGLESARRATLLQIKRGADLIKITATAGVLSVQGAGGGRLPQFTEEEIRVIVNTAADFGKKVTAHAHGAEGMKRAIRAGIASIEHGTFMDEETMELFKKHNVYYVPTIIAGKSVADSAKIEGYYQPVVTKKALEIGPAIQGTFAKAYKAGVPIAFGTDAGVFKHGANGKEFQYMVEAGMPSMAAIKSATYHAAKLLDVLDDLGTLEPGKIADVVATDENPLRDIKTLQNVTFVMKEGRVYKNETRFISTTQR